MLKLMDYLHIQVNKPWYNYYLYTYMYVLIHVMEIFYVCVHTGYEDFVCMNMFI